MSAHLSNVREKPFPFIFLLLLFFFFFFFLSFLLDKISDDGDIRSYRMHEEVKRERTTLCQSRLFR